MPGCQAVGNPAVLADDCGVPPPPLLRLAQPDKGYIPIRHLRALVQARICPFTLQTPYKGLLWKNNYIIYMCLQRQCGESLPLRHRLYFEASMASGARAVLISMSAAGVVRPPATMRRLGARAIACRQDCDVAQQSRLRRRLWAGGLGVCLHAQLVQLAVHGAVKVVGVQVGEGAAKVPEEAVARVCALHHVRGLAESGGTRKPCASGSCAGAAFAAELGALCAKPTLAAASTAAAAILNRIALRTCVIGPSREFSAASGEMPCRNGATRAAYGSG